MDILMLGQTILAQEGDGGTSGNLLGFLLPLLLLGGVFYFILIRPQRNQMRRRQELASSLEIGDEVRTSGGIIGTVRRMDEDTVVLEVEDGSLLRIVRMAVIARRGEQV